MAPKSMNSSPVSNPSIPDTSLSADGSITVRNIAHGVNYSIPSKDTIESSSSIKSECVEFRAPSTGNLSPYRGARQQSREFFYEQNNADQKQTTSSDTNIGTPQSVRKSQRRRKPHPQFHRLLPSDEKSRVRYDANLVPLVQRNPAFIKYWRSRDAGTQVIHDYQDLKPGDSKENEKPLKLHPFIGNDTVLWVPASRTEWEDCISEMAAICKAAALRRHSFMTNKLFAAPLSKDYIRDRVDIDDPLFGYQLRHKSGGWMQGFVMFTNFTNWSHYFKWDSMHEASGVQTAVNSFFKADISGSLAAELEAQERSGDPLAGGVVFSTIAEIGLIGGLGCGEYLLRMALEDIKAREHYKYVVLQATDSSRTFYERFGFVRVGAISRYGSRVKGKRPIDPQSVLSDVVGYRHWTYAHESEKSLDRHGGPSYMMALRIDRSNFKEGGVHTESFLHAMRQSLVLQKPKVKQLGASPTPFPKKSVLSFTSVPDASQQPELPLMEHTPTAAKKEFRKRRQISSLILDHSSNSSNSVENDVNVQISRKKQRIPIKSPYQFMQQRNELLTPPPQGAQLSYQQKQYQSVWLAVPPEKETPSRRIPRERPPFESNPQRRLSNTNASEGLRTVVTLEKEFDHHEQMAARSVVQKLEGGDAPGGSHEDQYPEPPGKSDTQCMVPTMRNTSKNYHDHEKVGFVSMKKQSMRPLRDLPSENHFANKVIRLKGSNDEKYFFVVNFDVANMELKVLPLIQDGVFGGKRSGRPKWKAQVHSQITVLNGNNCEIVRSHTVSKTPFIANESWDII